MAKRQAGTKKTQTERYLVLCEGQSEVGFLLQKLEIIKNQNLRLKMKV